jgi:hypothetical protein
MRKRVYTIDIERNVQGRAWAFYTLTVIAPNAEEACAKSRAEAKRRSGMSAPWFIRSLKEIGDAI